ncbi:MAG: tripartite tricarboxylate transporter substrate binding protein [Betaproteobacteria bacterium]|nr:tripartite tricarboxylate transporter substrate binding protein [Betaproteobacteria bacterium]
MPISKFWALTVAVAVGAFAPLVAAQQFPTRSIRIVVPFPPGGTTDVVARLVAQRMSESMGQSVVVENRAGAGGALGADVVAKAPADGYTLLMHNITFPLSSVAQTLAKRSPFNAETDFEGVSIAVYVPFVFTAHPSVPAKDIKELAGLLRGKPDLNYNYGSTGPGSAMHVLGESLKRDGKFDMTHIAYKGAAPLKVELVAGRIQFGGDQLSTSLQEIRGGQLKALATTGSRRISVLPDVPTVREQGFPALEFEGFNGLFAPAKTPRAVLERLQRETAAAVKHPDVAKRLTELAAVPVGSSGDEQKAMLLQLMKQFTPVIREMKLD